MRLLSTFRSLKRRPQPMRSAGKAWKRTRKPAPQRLYLEQLEDRTVLSLSSNVILGIPVDNLTSPITPGKIVQIDPSGSTTTLLQGQLRSVGLTDSIGAVALEPNGTIDFVGTYNESIGAFHFDPMTSSVRQISSLKAFGITVSPAGIVILGVPVDNLTSPITPGKIVQIDPSGNTTTLLQGELRSVPPADSIGSVALESNGTIDFVGTYNGSIGAFHFDPMTNGVQQISSLKPFGIAVVPSTTFQWTGKGSDNLWSDGANWLGGIAPTAGANLLFPNGAKQLSNQDDLGFDLGSITINDSYIFSGNPLTVTGNLDVLQGLTEFDNSATVDAVTSIAKGAGLNIGTGTTLKALGKLAEEGSLSFLKESFGVSVHGPI